MDDLDLLTKLRAEVPLAAPSPRAEQLFRAGLAETQSSERTRSSRPAARRFSGLRGRWGLLAPRTAVAVGLAAAVTAGILIAVLPSGQRPATVPPAQASGKAMSVQLLADLAAKAVQSGPAERTARPVGVPQGHVLPASPHDRRHVDDRRRH